MLIWLPSRHHPLPSLRTWGSIWSHYHTGKGRGWLPAGESQGCSWTSFPHTRHQAAPTAVIQLQMPLVFRLKLCPIQLAQKLPPFMSSGHGSRDLTSSGCAARIFCFILSSFPRGSVESVTWKILFTDYFLQCSTIVHASERLYLADPSASCTS